jgi:lauroyl/myristoyl acyltransferase
VTPTTAALTLFFDAGACGIGTLDTAAGTFTRKIESNQPARVIMLILSDQDLAAIRQKVAEIGFFDYPENFAASPASGAAGARVTPSITYTIEVQLDGQRKRVVWNDDISGATTSEGENLRTLIRMIEKAIQSTPEYQGLPQRNFGCL